MYETEAECKRGRNRIPYQKDFVLGESYRGMCGAKTEGELKVFIALECLGDHAKNRAAKQRDFL